MSAAKSSTPDAIAAVCGLGCISSEAAAAYALGYAAAEACIEINPVTELNKTLDPNPKSSWTKTQSAATHVPPIAEVAEVINKGLSADFATVVAEEVDCPDLTQSPYNLAAAGICGSPRLADVGGPPYLVPTVQRNKIYNIADIAEEVGLPGAMCIGAGAGSSRLTGTNCELMPNTHISTGKIKTHFAKMKHGKPVLEHYSSNEFGLLGNLLCTEGKPGKVLKVTATGRIGEKTFVNAIRTALAKHYGEKPIAIGGVFIIGKGNAKLHVMPDFSKTPVLTDEDVDNWLHYYEANAPLTMLSTFVSHDPGLDLRVEHTHGFNEKGQGGHYHYDTTPEYVEYTGIFTIAEHIFRVDAPAATHQVGRD